MSSIPPDWAAELAELRRDDYTTFAVELDGPLPHPVPGCTCGPCPDCGNPDRDVCGHELTCPVSSETSSS
jgi:hypothetical protein